MSKVWCLALLTGVLLTTSLPARADDNCSAVRSFAVSIYRDAMKTAEVSTQDLEQLKAMIANEGTSCDATSKAQLEGLTRDLEGLQS